MSNISVAEPTQTQDNLELPDYVIWDDLDPTKSAVLRTPAKKIIFPLSADDQKDIDKLISKYDHEASCSGLAAPQIGIGKSIIIFAAEDPSIKKWRPDFTQTMPKTLWINPPYEPIGEEVHEDYEACFSVKGMAGLVKRYKQIDYQAYNREGDLVEGKAEGFLARIIQHEIDHLNGILFIDLVDKNELMSIEEYRKRRSALIEQQIS